MVSQGLDFYISALLKRDGYQDVPVYAVATRFDAGRISYQYHHAYPGQENRGNSKRLIVEGFRSKGHYVIYAGDGQSDLEAARVADRVFAHRTLARLCDEEGIPYTAFEDFQGVLLAVRDLSVNGPNRASGEDDLRDASEVTGQ